MADFIIAIALILSLLSGWIAVQHLARKFATKHPDLGPAREEGGSCGTSCLCSNSGSCRKKQNSKTNSTLNQEDHQYDPT